jgi:ankyrin repeat protein
MHTPDMSSRFANVFVCRLLNERHRTLHLALLSVLLDCLCLRLPHAAPPDCGSLTFPLLELLLQEGRTPLLRASQFGHVEVVEQLLGARASMNTVNKVRLPSQLRRRYGQLHAAAVVSWQRDAGGEAWRSWLSEPGDQALDKMGNSGREQLVVEDCSLMALWGESG